MKKLIVFALIGVSVLASCKKDSQTPAPTANEPKLIFKFKFDSTQARLDGFGNPSTLPANHRAQCPHFNGMSVHHIEMAPTIYTGVGQGNVLYTTPTSASSPVTVWNAAHTQSQTYTDAIDFTKETIVGDGQEFFSIPLSQVTAGTYPYLRISVAYQNYTIKYAIKSGTSVGGYTVPQIYNTGTIASFIGYNTNVNSFKIKNQTVTLNSPNNIKQQGYWAFEADPYMSYTYAPVQGQAPQGATTVVNPLFASSAVPPGSCLITGAFVNQAGTTTPLTITGKETSDVVITVSMSTNNSFEWKHDASNPDDGYIYTLNGDTVVDMGLRGMMPKLPQ
jgi:hypothetical protein